VNVNQAAFGFGSEGFVSSEQRGEIRRIFFWPTGVFGMRCTNGEETSVCCFWSGTVEKLQSL